MAMVIFQFMHLILLALDVAINHAAEILYTNGG